MKIELNPNRDTWATLCERPKINCDELNEVVSSILQEVKTRGDEALKDFSLRFDGIELNSLAVLPEEFDLARSLVSDELKKAIEFAKTNITLFHKSQTEQLKFIETTPGVVCWREARPIEKVGLYIPGGSAALFSSLLMLGVPAQIAGCKEIVVCTPPQKNGNVDPCLLYTAELLGIKQVYKVGGAQAIAALTYGTASIPPVYKIFGPGNQYVTKAKELVQQAGVAIDMPAGPSEVLVIADETGVPAFIAADLLAQAEHGADSQVVLVSTSEQVVQKVLAEIELQLAELPRVEIARAALQFMRVVIFDSIQTCFDFSNAYSPEHLIIASTKAKNYISLISNAGSVFIGNYSCESAGDYASGTNHTLPTNGYARNYSGVSLDSFIKKITFQELSAIGIQNLGPSIECLADSEGLQGHKNAVTIRLKQIQNA